MSTPPDEQHEQSPWSRPGVLISGAFLLALILAGILVAVVGGGSHHTTHSTAQHPAASSTTPTSPSSTACTLPAGSQTIPSSSPPPGRSGPRSARCRFRRPRPSMDPSARTGLQHVLRPQSLRRAARRDEPLGGGHRRDPSARCLRTLAVGAPRNLGNSDRLDAGGPVQFAGYRYDSYNPTTARSAVVIRGPEGKLAAAVTTMRWVAERLEIRVPAGRRAVVRRSSPT